METKFGMDNMALILGVAAVVIVMAGWALQRVVDSWLEKSKSMDLEVRRLVTDLAVIGHRLEKVEKDINSIGKLIRDFRSDLCKTKT